MEAAQDALFDEELQSGSISCLRLKYIHCMSISAFVS